MLRKLSLFALFVAALASPGLAHAGYPSLSDVTRAVRQHGPAVFGDIGLLGGAFKRIGPNITSYPGGTSVVYPMTDIAGKTWAVRVFTRQPPHDRHEAIVRAINESGLGDKGTGLFPEVKYVKQGIKLTVDGKEQWFPIMKMAWVTGKKLDQHIDSLISAGQHASLEQLAEDWRAVHASLRQKNIAHGDLQHGNILMKPDGKLQLIDFDDIFVEGFRGQKSGGGGHPSFAHPSREGRDFYLDVDNFSSLVIYTSLKALAHDPAMWKDKDIHIDDGNGGGDNLIFQKSDFEEPAESAVFKRLAKSSSPEVRKLAAHLAEYAQGHVSEVPPLEHLLAGTAWKPDGTVPDDFERVESDAPAEAGASHATKKPAAGDATLKEPGPNASPMEWQMYRMKVVQQQTLHRK